MQDEGVLSLRRLADLDLRDAPAVMLQRSRERRRASDIARQPDRGWVETGRHRDGRFLLALEHRLQVEMVLQHFLARLMNRADAGAERLVVGAIDVLQQEID